MYAIKAPYNTTVYELNGDLYMTVPGHPNGVIKAPASVVRTGVVTGGTVVAYGDEDTELYTETEGVRKRANPAYFGVSGRDGTSVTIAPQKLAVTTPTDLDAMPQKGDVLAGYRVTSPFGEPRARGYHQGVDVATPRGTPVFAPFSGTVVAKSYADYPDGAGNRIYLSNEVKELALFHLDRFAVGNGPVRQGDLLGYTGNSGHAVTLKKSGPMGYHLHLGRVIRKNGKITWVSPTRQDVVDVLTGVAPAMPSVNAPKARSK